MRKGNSFKDRRRSHYSSCLISAIFSPSSSLKIFSCPLFSVKELPRPSPIVLRSLTSLVLTTSLQSASPCVSQPLWKRKLFKIRKNFFANMFSFVQHKRTPAEEMIKESLSPHWVPSGIIESCHLCNWILLSNFCKEKHVGIEHDDKSFLTKELLLFKLW